MSIKNQRSDEDWQILWSEVTETFSPGAPIQEKELFAGRIEELRSLLDAVNQRGRHAVVFGERGVGKSSITNILCLMIRGPKRQAVPVKVNADANDTFSSLWKKVFKRLHQETADGQSTTLASGYPGELTPDDVQLELSNFSGNQVPVIVLDEFDRVRNREVTVQLADTLKALSDYSVNATIVIAGVAKNLGELFAEHGSIVRSSIQVKMPRMSQDELGDVISRRYKKCGFTVDEESLWKMTFLSRGLPYYAQLLGMHSARQAISQRTTRITPNLVEDGLRKAVAELDQTIKETYLTAIRTQRTGDALYGPALLACALAKCDELGHFQQVAVKEPLNRITGKMYQASTFAFHMNAFCEPERKCVLERDGEPRGYRYRFTDPLMQPFVILKGLAEGLIDDITAEVYANRRQLKLSNDW